MKNLKRRIKKADPLAMAGLQDSAEDKKNHRLITDVLPCIFNYTTFKGKNPSQPATILYKNFI